MSGAVAVIVNVAAGRGRGARVLPLVRDAFRALDVNDIRCTAAPGEESLLAARALEDGAGTIVAVGGDGTWSNVANAILASATDARLGFIAAGSGNDFAKTIGAPARDVEESARLAVNAPDVRVDVGRVEGRHFLNAAGFGFDIAVLEDARRRRWPRGRVLYPYAALRQLFFYDGFDVEVESPNGRRTAGRQFLLVVANGRQFGGSFRIAPEASVFDGRLDVLIVRSLPLAVRLPLLTRTLWGSLAGPRVIREQARRFTLRFPSPPAYETDGEYRRARSCELELDCAPKALRVVVPEAVLAERC